MPPTAQILRLDELDSPEALTHDVPATAATDAAHGTTGWSAYDVWRTRVFVKKGHDEPRGNS